MIDLERMSVVDYYDIIVNELCTGKSVAALIYMINRGRELEFKYKDTDGFISRSGSQSYVSLWCNKGEQAFLSLEDLLENAVIDGEKLVDIWADIKIGYLF